MPDLVGIMLSEARGITDAEDVRIKSWGEALSCLADDELIELCLTLGCLQVKDGRLVGITDGPHAA